MLKEPVKTAMNTLSDEEEEEKEKGGGGGGKAKGGGAVQTRFHVLISGFRGIVLKM